MAIKALVLDRDGVINADSPDYIKSPEEWHPIPGSIEAIAQAKRAGIPVGIITNQSGVGRGYYSLETLADIHDKMYRLLAAHDTSVDCLFFCPHEPGEQCPCRKPKPSMLQMCARAFNVDLQDVMYLGDKLSDFQTEQAAGSQFALVTTGYGQATQKDSEIDLCFPDLSSAINTLLPR